MFGLKTIIFSLFATMALASPVLSPKDVALSGDFTHYATGLGACGIIHSDADYVVALSPQLFDPSTPAGNPNHNTLCGRKIKASYGGKTVTVEVADRCAGCPGLNDLDLSPPAFKDLADLGVGRIQGTWEWA
ncbi:RlpA-like double-psi beta-barrel-protein domain-containing protein-containing protein [Podospora conica]|nr:RlpA-like double-psi beta-barrel-protein domain-containing protein-containing protein [Schizothecium conicum]